MKWKQFRVLNHSIILLRVLNIYLKYSRKEINMYTKFNGYIISQNVYVNNKFQFIFPTKMVKYSSFRDDNIFIRRKTITVF